MSICLKIILKIIRTNQQQLNKMANPYTQGLRYNYKPLDLSTIGKAAVMNQGQYDQTQSALDEFDVSINALSQQEDWARGEESKYREKIDALSEGLAQSKDPRASMRQLAKLNKEYKRRTGPGGDIGIVEGNVATMQDYRKRHQKMIADGKNVPANFNTFLSMQMEGFKGFDDEGKLQSLGLQDMTANKSKEMTDRAIELGKLSKADVKMQLGKYASIGGFRKEAIDTKLEELNNEERAVYIQQVLANSAEFKPYLDQERSLIEYRNKGFDGETYMGNQLGTLDKNTEALEAQLAGKGLNENQKAAIQNNLNAIEQKRKQLSQGIDKYGAMQYGQMLKSNAEYNNLTALPAGTANLRNYKEKTFSRSGYTDQAGLASYRSSLRQQEWEKQNPSNAIETPYNTTTAFTGKSKMEVMSSLNDLTKKLDTLPKDSEDYNNTKREIETAKAYIKVGQNNYNEQFAKDNAVALKEAGLTVDDLNDKDKMKDYYISQLRPEDKKVLMDSVAKMEKSFGKKGYKAVYEINNQLATPMITVKYQHTDGQYLTTTTSGLSGSASQSIPVSNASLVPKAANKFIKSYKDGQEKYFKEGNISQSQFYSVDNKTFSNDAQYIVKDKVQITEIAAKDRDKFKELKASKDSKLTGVIENPSMNKLSYLFEDAEGESHVIDIKASSREIFGNKNASPVNASLKKYFQNSKSNTTGGNTYEYLQRSSEYNSKNIYSVDPDNINTSFNETYNTLVKNGYQSGNELSKKAPVMLRDGTYTILEKTGDNYQYLGYVASTGEWQAVGSTEEEALKTISSNPNLRSFADDVSPIDFIRNAAQSK